MQIGRIRILTPDLLGPGYRVGIWTRGCHKQCPGCMAGDLRCHDPGAEVPAASVLALAGCLYNTQAGCSGWTISGGEPLDQIDELVELLQGLRHIGEDILLYTGYDTEEMHSLFTHNQRAQLDRLVAVWITGPYQVERDNGSDPLRGSNNQQIAIKPEFMLKYQDLMSGQVRRRYELLIHHDSSELILTGMIAKE